MKIYITKIKESWIIDRIKKEWEVYQNEFTTKNQFNADILWVIAPWAINQDKLHKKNKKKIVYSIYHVEDTSEESIELAQLRKIEEFVDAFHVISIETKEILMR